MFRHVRLKLERINSLTQSKIDIEKINNDSKALPDWGELCAYLVVAISGCIFILLASSWTSPLYKNAYGFDASWYSLAGRAIVEGKVPYKDLFDLKGPTLFFYEAIGQFFIRGRNGIYLIQCISISFTAVLIYKCARLYAGKIWSSIVLILFYFVYADLLWGGNTVEELFMPLNMICIYLALKCLKNREFENTETKAFVFGISFFIIFWGKMTVAAPMVAATLTVFICLLIEKRYAEVINCIKYFFFAGFCTTAPILAYFMMRGALKDMIFCVFQLGFKRGTDYYESFSLEWELNLMICSLVFVFSILLWLKKKVPLYIKIFMTLMSVVIYALLHLGTPYTYYFITELPLYVCFLIFLPCLATKIKVKRPISLISAIVSVAIFFTILIYFGQNSLDKIEENIDIYKHDGGSEYVQQVREIYAEIPENEKDELYNLESGMIFYEVLQELPNNKYPVNLPYFLHLYPEIKTNVLNYLDVKKPAWIVSENLYGFDDEDIRNYVWSHYMQVKVNGAEELYWRVK